MKPLTFVELFAGIGGFSLGFERAGMECIGHCEINPYAQKVLRKNWPNVPLWDDVKKLKPSDLGSPDIICGGFPCQDLSVAGKQKGIHGERTGLFQEIIRLCRDVRPKYIVLENVRQLSSKQDWFCEVLARLCEIGYDAEWEVISAAQFGAPHKRERVWIVAYPRCTLWTGGNEEGKHREEGERRTTSKLEQPSSSPETMAYPNSQWKPQQEGVIQDERRWAGYNGESISYPHEVRLQEERTKQQATRLNQLCGQVPNSSSENRSSWGLSEREEKEKPTSGKRCENEGWPSSWEKIWAAEPNVGRVAYGVPQRVDRLKCLGNALVPQIAEWIGQRIVQDYLSSEGSQ